MIIINKNEDLNFSLLEISGQIETAEAVEVTFWTTDPNFSLKKNKTNITSTYSIPLSWNELNLMGRGIMFVKVNVGTFDVNYNDFIYNKILERQTEFYIMSDYTVNDQNNLTEQVAINTTDIHNLKLTDMQISGDVETLKTDVDTLQTDVDDLDTRVEVLENENETNKTNIQTNTDNITTVSGNVTALTSDLEAVRSDLNSLSGNTYTKAETDAKIAAIDVNVFEVVTTLPTENINPNKIYLVPSETTGESNIYTEYTYKNGAWEKLGEYKADVDLSAYAFKADVEALSGTVEDNERVTAEALYKLNSGLTETKNSLSGYATTAVTTALRNDVDAISGTVSGLSDTYYAKVNDLTIGKDEENEPMVKLGIRSEGNIVKTVTAGQFGFGVNMATDGVDEHYNVGYLYNDEMSLGKREYFEGDTTTDEELGVLLNYYDGLSLGRWLIDNATYRYKEAQGAELTKDDFKITNSEWDVTTGDATLIKEAKLETTGLTLDSFEDGADEWINNITTVNSEGFKVVDRANPSNVLFGIDRNGVDFYASEYTSLGSAALPIHYRKTWAELTTRNEVGIALDKKYDKVSGLTFENSGITFVDQDGSTTATAKYTNKGINLSVKNNGTEQTLFNLDFLDGTIEANGSRKIISELVQNPDLDALRTEMEEYVDEAISAATSGGSQADTSEIELATAAALNDLKGSKATYKWVRENYASKDATDDLQSQIDNSNANIQTLSGDVATNATNIETKANKSYVLETEKNTANVLCTINDRFDGITLKRISQTDYDSLTTKNPNTLYIIS